MSNDPTDPSTTSPYDPAPYDPAAVARARGLLDVVPDHIGPYRILERIGGGGMGEVYRAEQRTPIRREVALKLIKLGMDTKLVIARFEAERQALAMMDHPHIARVFDAGADPTGRPYFVMEYVKGTPINQYADEKRLTIRQRLELFAQVCQAVQHAHTKGVIHRDLKPSNVLVITQDGKPFAKAIDFGIAKATNARLTEKTLFTEHKAMIGTPEYMSPEQADGNIDIDARTDIYSLGVLLYELLTGQTPFDATRLRSAAYDAMVKIIRDEDPPKPSARLTTLSSLPLPLARGGRGEGQSPLLPLPLVGGGRGEGQPSSEVQTLATLAKSRSLDPTQLLKQVRGELDWLVMKAMEKDRARRYETPTGLAEDIARYLDGSPVKAAPPSAGYRVRKFVRKHRAPVTAAATVVALLLLGVAGTTVLLAGQARARRDAENATTFAKAETSRAESATTRESARATEAEQYGYAATLGSVQAALAAYQYPEARELLATCPEHLRGWEWHFLEAQAAIVRTAWRGGTLQDVSRDKRIIVWTSGDVARLWDFTGRPVGELMREEGNVRAAEFSSDGTHILTTSADNRTARVWDTTGRMVGEPMRDVDIYSAKFSPDGSKVLTETGNTIRLWDLAGRPVGGSIQEVGDNYTAKFSPDGSKVVTGGGNGISLWDLRGRQVGKQIRGVDIYPTFSPDGSKVLTLMANTARLWDLAGQPVGKSIGYDGHIHSAEFSPDGSKVLTVSSNHIVRLWDLAGRPVSEPMLLEADKYDLYTAKFNPSSSLVLTEAGNTARLWDLAGRPVGEPMRHDGRPSAQFSSDGSMVLTTSTDEAWVWDLAGRPLTSLEAPQGLRWGWIWPLWFIDSETLIFQGDGSDVSFISRLSDMRRVRQTTASDDRDIIAAVEIEDGLRVGATSTYQSAIDSRKATATYQAMVAETQPPDRTRRVVGAADGSVRFFDVATGRQMAVFHLQAGITRLRFTPDGTRLLIDRADNVLEIWDTRNPATQRRFLAREFDERPAARDYVQRLFVRDMPLEKLAAVVKGDPSLNELQKLVALKELDWEVKQIEQKADREFEQLKTAFIVKGMVNRHRDDVTLEPRVRQTLIRRIEAWSPSHEDYAKALWQIVADRESSATITKSTLSQIEAEGLGEPNGRGGWRINFFLMQTAEARDNNVVAGMAYRTGRGKWLIWNFDCDAKAEGGSQTKWLPECRIFMAMALADNDRLADAKQVLKEVHETVGYLSGSQHDQDIARLLKEADDLVKAWERDSQLPITAKLRRAAVRFKQSDWEDASTQPSTQPATRPATTPAATRPTAAPATRAVATSEDLPDFSGLLRSRRMEGGHR